MKRRHSAVLRTGNHAILLLGLLIGSVTFAQSRPSPPDVLSFQGTLVGADGTAIGASGTVNIPVVFRVFTRATGGQLLWSEQQTLAVREGVFSTLLGEGSVFANEPRPPLSSIFEASNASDRYVEVTVRGAAGGEADATVEPRTRLVSGAYSLLASRARTAEDMVNADGRSLLTPSGDRVGINKSNPAANLDVAGSMAARGWNVRQTLTVAGTAEGGGFNGLGMAPVGSILMWTGTTPPTGWVFCDGSVVAGVSTPDLRGRFVLGAGNGQGLTSRSLNQTGGEEGHVLTTSEMPRHSHSVAYSGQTTGELFGWGMGWLGDHEYRSAIVGNSLATQSSSTPNRARLGSSDTSQAGGHAHDFDIPAFGSMTQGEGRPHNTMPPFYVLAFIMRVQ